jgi:hypothetical protein
MFLQEAFYISLCLFVAFITTLPNPNPDFDDSHLPSLRLSREEVQEMKERQIYPPGYVHKYITMGDKSTPIVELDPDILLDDDDGVSARSLVPREVCGTIAPTNTYSCNINYCWLGTNRFPYTEAITITGSNGVSNPISVTTSNRNNLQLDPTYNNGEGHYFPTGHECSNDDTQMYTDHNLNTSWAKAHVTDLDCYFCTFASLLGEGAMVNAGLVAYTNGGASEVACVWGKQGP